MTLRKKTLLIIGCAFIVLIGGLYFPTSRILINRFTDLEKSHTIQDVQRAQDTLTDDIAELGRQTNDWATWDDSYVFIDDRNEAYLASNLGLTTSWVNNRLNAMMYVDTSGLLVYGQGFDLIENEMVAIPESFLAYGKKGSPLLEHADLESSHQGIIMLPEGPMMVSSEPIITSDGSGPSRGSLIWGRLLDEQQIGHLARILHLSLTSQNLDETLPADFQQAESEIAAGEQVAVQPLGDNLVAGYTVVNDINGDPALMLRVDAPRDIFNHGQATSRYLIATIISASLVFTLITLFLIESWVLSPVARMSADVRRIGEQADHAERVKTSGSDELSLLAKVINKMLAGLQDSQMKLKNVNTELELRVKERTADLLDKVGALQALAEIDREVIASIKSPAILELACRRTAEVLHVAKTLIFVTGQPAGSSVAASFGITDEAGIEQEVTIFMQESLRRESELMERGAYGEKELSADYAFFPRMRANESVRALAAAPLFAEGKFLGFILAFDTGPRPWTDDEIRILSLIAAQVALAIDQSRLFEQEQDRREELSSLYELARGLADAAPSEDEILRLVTRHAVEKVHITFCRIAMIENDRFVIRAAYPVRDLDVDLFAESSRGKPSDALLWRAVGQERPLVVQYDDSGLNEEDRDELFMGIASHICLVPLREGKKPIGVLMLGESRHVDREPFAEEKIRLAHSIGDQTVSALQRAWLFTQLEHTYLETVLSLASAVEAKDTYTADHAESLAMMAVVIGGQLGMTCSELDDLRYGAILHDVGKIGIPDIILQKPGKLNNAEWVKMKKHPSVGAKILEPVPRLAKASRVVRHHHERYDGGGYPDELAGDAIPIGARILTVVDSFSAIIDKRVYKEANSREYAIGELRRCSGTQFDPEIVELFIGLLESGELDRRLIGQDHAG